jgi:Sec-independent protein translocase protein TatA
VVVKTGLYKRWLDYNDRWHSTTLIQKTEEKIFLLKEEVRKARRRKKAQEKADERCEKKSEEKEDTERTDAKDGPASARSTGRSFLAWCGRFRRKATTEEKDPEQQNGLAERRPRPQPASQTFQLSQPGVGAAGQDLLPSAT